MGTRGRDEMETGDKGANKGKICSIKVLVTNNCAFIENSFNKFSIILGTPWQQL